MAMFLATLFIISGVVQGQHIFDSSECGRSKGCYLPSEAECYQGCNGMRVSWLRVTDELMKIEMTVNADSNEKLYVAVGFSKDDLMGDDIVIECSALQGQDLSLKFSYNINGTTDPTTKGEPDNRRLPGANSDYFLDSDTSFSDGVIFCSGLVNITAAVTGDSLNFDPTRLYYLLMANGPTEKTDWFYIVPGFETDSCGVSKGCFLGSNTDATLNGLAVSYRVVNNSYIAFELVAPSTTDTGTFVAVSFSQNGLLPNTPTIECSSLGNNSLSMKFSYNDASGTNVRIPGEETIRDTYFTQETAVFQDGQLYCSAVVNVQGSDVSTEIFKYTGASYLLILATGSTNENGLLVAASSQISSLATTLSQYEPTFDATTCDVDKNCVLPEQCYRGCNGIGMSYKILSNSLMHIELFAVLSARNQYIAVGFSDDDKMGNDYVIECSALENQLFSMKFSYNNNSPANVRIPGEETIRSSYFTQNMVVVADGELYCSANVNISGWSQNKQVFKYNPGQSYYLLFASGFTDAQGLTVHKHTFVSTSRLLATDNSLNGFNSTSCGTAKGCFLSSRSNGMAVSYVIVPSGFMRIELTMVTAATSSVYLAVGFSLDDQMGNDNVIECSALTGESLSMKFSYNTGRNNVRIKGEETIRSQYFRNETATITDGVLYCSATVDVRGWPSSNGQVFAYKENQTYYLLLATGSALSSSLAQHKITDVSSSRHLSDYGADGNDGGMSSTAKSRLIKAHAILMIVAWFFFIPTAAMFARFLRTSWPTLKPGGMLIWFHVHRTCNSLAITLTIASFACIFTANNWNWTGPGSQSSKWGKTHTMVGVFALGLCWIQPFISAMRCNPSHPRRPFFNWAHRGIGITAMVLATTTICIAADHFLSVWPHRITQITLSLVPLTLICFLSIIFLLLNKFIEVDELNVEKINGIRELVVYLGVLAVASVTVVLSVFVGIGA